MFRRKSIIVLLLLLSTASFCSAGKIPQKIGKWQVKVGPPGNEVYQEPKMIPQNTPPSQAVLRHAKILLPGMRCEWEIDEDCYKLQCEKNEHEYQLEITQDGKLIELEYKNKDTDVEEKADELAFKGSKKTISPDALPKNTLEALSKLYPGKKPANAWTADTIAGPRFVIQIAAMAFYARPDGQIQAARAVNDEGLDEIDPDKADEEKLTPKQFKARLKKLLGPYKQKFNFENQIKKLGNSPKKSDGSYRYVVMGDSRSQWGLWSAMVKHIDTIEPKPAFIINSGDLVPKGFISEFHDYFIPPLLKTDIPLFVAIGNHDEGYDDKVLEYRFLFGEKSLNYYFDYGKTRYIFIDNCTEISEPEDTLKWLEKTLSKTPNGFKKFVATHKPPANIDKWEYHSWDDKESKKFTGLMTKYSVTEVYLGHIHAYSTAKLGGVKYTLSGGGGASLHDRFGPLGNIHHYVICDVMPDGSVKQQVVRFYDKDQ